MAFDLGDDGGGDGQDCPMCEDSGIIIMPVDARAGESAVCTILYIFFTPHHITS